MFQFPPYAMILFISAAVCMGLGMYALFNRQNRLFFYFGVSFLLAGMWPLFYGIELCISDKNVLEYFTYLKAFPIQFFPIFFVSMIHLIIKQQMPPRWLMITMISFTVIAVLMILSDNWTGFAFDGRVYTTTPEGYNLIILIPGLWIKYNTLVYHFGSNLLVISMLAKGLLSRKRPYRIQFQLIILSVASAVIFSAMYVFRLVDFGYYNPLPAILLITSTLTAIAIFRYQMLSIIPYARETVFENTDSPVVVADQSGCILDYNPAAKHYFRMTSDMISQDISAVFQRLGIDIRDLETDRAKSVQTKWGAGNNAILKARKVQLEKDDMTAYLYIFSDITAEMNAMITAHEKEIVTYKESILGDMHDGIGGVVATAAILAQSAIEDSAPGEKDRKLGEIAKLLANGSFELRSMLNILDKDHIDWSTLIFDMRSYSSTVLDTRNISRKMEVNGTPPKIPLGFDIYLTIFRIFKECITNVIKHSGANHVNIYITFKEESFVLEVADDGKGLDGNTGKGYGMRSLHKRAEKLGGKLDIRSENGTKIQIDIPVI